MTLNACFDAAIATGFILSNDVGEPKRGIPVIVFDKFHDSANEFVTAIRKWYYLETRAENQSDQYRLLIDRLNIDDPSGYLYNLAFAYMFASQTRWRVALILADRAIEIAKTKPEAKEGTKISGREAYYLRAIAQRLLSRNMEELNSAPKFLEKAEKAHSWDCTTFADYKVTTLRFEVERVAVELTRAMLGVFVEAQSSQESSGILDEVLRSATRLLESCRSEDHPRVKAKATRDLLSDIFSAQILRVRDLPPAEQISVLTASKDYFFEWRDLMSSDHEMGSAVTYMHRSIFRGAQCACDGPQSKSELRLLREHIEVELSDPNIEKNTVTIYDAAHYRELRRFCLNLLHLT